MQNGEGGTRAARSPWDIDASLCGILSFLFTWNWIVSQSPTSLTVEWGAWRIPARAILLVSFAVAGFTLFALRRYRPVAAPKIRRVRSITVAMVLAAGILVPDILDGRFDGELAGAPFAAQMIFMGVASAYLTTVVGTLFGLKGIARPCFSACRCKSPCTTCPAAFGKAPWWLFSYRYLSCMAGK